MNTYSAFYSDRPRVGGVLSHSQTEGREEGGSRAQEGREVGGFGRKIVVVRVVEAKPATFLRALWAQVGEWNALTHDFSG